MCVFNTPNKNKQTTLLFSWLLGNTGWSDVSGAAELTKHLPPRLLSKGTTPPPPIAPIANGQWWFISSYTPEV